MVALWVSTRSPSRMESTREVGKKSRMDFRQEPVSMPRATLFILIILPSWSVRSSPSGTSSVRAARWLSRASRSTVPEALRRRVEMRVAKSLMIPL